MKIQSGDTAYRSSRIAGTLLLAALLGGCVSYSANQLTAMSTLDLCETEYMQRMNLSTETRQAIARELQRRNDDCRNHAVEVAQRYQAFMHRETYGRIDNP